MIRNVIIFLGTFIAGALIALVARAALYNPHADREPQPAGGGDYSGMVSNSASIPKAGAESARASGAPAPQASADSHAGHGATPQPGADRPVNTVCAICGMDVDPTLPTATYKGKTIGFGCRMCPPKFKADPDRYGPYYLRNEVIKD